METFLKGGLCGTIRSRRDSAAWQKWVGSWWFTTGTRVPEIVWCRRGNIKWFWPKYTEAQTKADSETENWKVNQVWIQTRDRIQNWQKCKESLGFWWKLKMFLFWDSVQFSRQCNGGTGRQIAFPSKHLSSFNFLIVSWVDQPRFVHFPKNQFSCLGFWKKFPPCCIFLQGRSVCLMIDGEGGHLKSLKRAVAERRTLLHSRIANILTDFLNILKDWQNWHILEWKFKQEFSKV